VRRQFGVVLQESVLFSGSILSNITLNNPAIDRNLVVEAATVAAIHDDIARMPMGYDTFISEGGSALSGGQRQRLAIARAIAHSPTILLLDEATSHLDVVTERRVAEKLLGLACTQIIIAHRLSTIRDADVILVIDQGTIVERGSHDELLECGGYYASLMREQLEPTTVPSEPTAGTTATEGVKDNSTTPMPASVEAVADGRLVETPTSNAGRDLAGADCDLEGVDEIVERESLVHRDYLERLKAVDPTAEEEFRAGSTSEECL